jgi:hypothetical protein
MGISAYHFDHFGYCEMRFKRLEKATATYEGNQDGKVVTVEVMLTQDDLTDYSIDVDRTYLLKDLDADDCTITDQ